MTSSTTVARESTVKPKTSSSPNATSTKKRSAAAAASSATSASSAGNLKCKPVIQKKTRPAVSKAKKEAIATIATEDLLKGKKKSGKKDDNGKKIKKPKRISKPSAYSMFSQNLTKSLKDKFPDYDFGQRSREVAARWTDLSQDEKQKYQDIADKYWEEKLAKLKQDGVDIHNLNGQPKKKRFPNAYTIFLRDNHALVKGEHPDWSFQEISQEIARRWKNLSEEEKIKYTSIVAEIKSSAAAAAAADELTESASTTQQEVNKTTNNNSSSSSSNALEEKELPAINDTKNVPVEEHTNASADSHKDVEMKDATAASSADSHEDVEMKDVVAATADEAAADASVEHGKKKKVTAYNIFCSENRSVLEGKFPDKPKYIAENLRKTWKGFDKAHRAPYEAKAASINSE